MLLARVLRCGMPGGRDQEKMEDLAKNKDYIDNVIKSNAEKAQYVSNKTLRKVQKKIGFPERIR